MDQYEYVEIIKRLDKLEKEVQWLQNLIKELAMSLGIYLTEKNDNDG